MTATDIASSNTIAAALLGADYPNLRIRPEVQEGDNVAPGQILFRDAKHPEIAFAAPIQGRVTSIRLAARRMLSAVTLAPADVSAVAPDDRIGPDQSIRDYLLARGMWPAFVSRPFGGPPHPDAKAAAIVVSAVQSSRVAPDPGDVLRGQSDAFTRGMEAIAELTDGSVHLCLANTSRIDAPALPRLQVHRRSERRWSSPAAQVARVAPASPGRATWTIGYQDVVAIGHLLETGRYDPVRRVALWSDTTRPAPTLNVPLGADLSQLLGQPGPEHQTWSGAAPSGRVSAFLGRHHLDASLVAHARPAPKKPHPIIPLAGLGRALPIRLPAIPLMRSLAVGDAETSARLGCLQLLEDDIAPITAICTSGTDYARRLRDVLDRLRSDLS